MLIVGIGGAISLLISNGGLIQTVFFAFLIEQDARSLYEALYDDAISQFPSLVDWIAAAIHPVFLCLSCAIAAVIVLRPFKSFQSFLLAVGVFTLLGLSLIDAAFLLWQGEYAVGRWIKNLIGNTIGGLAVAFVLAVVIAGSLRLFRSSKIPSPWVPYIASGIALTVGIFSSVLMHLILRSVLHPLPADIRITSGIPTSTITVGPVDTSSQNEWPNLIPKNAEVESLDLTVLDNVEVQWQKTEAQPNYSLSLYAIHGCRDISDFRELAIKEPVFLQESISNVSFLADLKMSFLFVDGKQTQINIDGSPIKVGWLDRDGENSTLDIQHLLSEDTTVQARTSGSISAMITGGLPVPEEGQPFRSSERFSLIVDDQEMHVIFSHAAEERLPEPMECTALLPNYEDAKVIQFDSHWLVGLFMHIERMESTDLVNSDYDGQLSIVDPKGWLEVKGIDPSHSVDSIGFISIAKPTGRMEFEDTFEDLNGDQAFQGYGEIGFSFSHEGNLLIDGEYYASWLGTRRLNRARFEVGPLELLVLLIPLGVLFFWPRKWIRKEWARNESNIFQAMHSDGS